MAAMTATVDPASKAFWINPYCKIANIVSFLKKRNSPQGGADRAGASLAPTIYVINRQANCTSNPYEVP